MILVNTESSVYPQFYAELANSCNYEFFTEFELSEDGEKWAKFFGYDQGAVLAWAQHFEIPYVNRDDPSRM